MRRAIPIVIGVALIAVTGVIQGTWSERWGQFPELKLFADQLANVPTQIGDWTSESREEPTQRVLEAAGAAGSLSRDYRSPRGEMVSVFLVCGRVQDMFYHEPKRCYSSAGFEMQREPERQQISFDTNQTADFFYSRFIKEAAEGRSDQIVYWSWCGNGEWIAPDTPKSDFSGQRAIYKLYVVYMPTRESTNEQNAALDFIPQLLPALNKAFEKAFAASGSAAAN